MAIYLTRGEPIMLDLLPRFESSFSCIGHPSGKIRSTIALCLLGFTVTACERPIADAVGPKAGPYPLRDATVAAAFSGRSQRGIEDDFLRVESKVPGFGGFFIDDSGFIVAFLKDLNREGELRTALQELISSKQEGVYNPLVETKGITVRQGQYSFSDLIAWQQALSKSFGTISGFAAIDADEMINRVSVGVVEADAQPRLLAQARTLGIPEGAVVFRKEDEIGSREATLASTWRPTAGGIQITPNGVNTCSLGFNGRDSVLLDLQFITASHCINDITLSTGSVGAAFYQPLSSPIGTVSVNIPWTATDPACGTYTYCTHSDVMKLTYDSPFITSELRVKLTPLGSTTVNGFNDIVAWVTPTVGLQLYKVGRTTGSSVGNVQATCENRVTFGPVGSLMNLCVDRVAAASSGGDSGAPVTRKLPNNQAAMVGILLGASGISGQYILTNWIHINSVIGTFTPY